MLQEENQTLRRYLKSLGLEVPKNTMGPRSTALGHHPKGPTVTAQYVATDAALAVCDSSG